MTAAPTVLAAVEDSPDAVSVARWASQIARAGGGEVVVFVTLPVPPAIHGLAGLRWLDDAVMIEDEGAATVGRVRPVLERMGVPFRVEVRPCLARRSAGGRARQAAGALLRAARDVGADLIVLGYRPVGGSSPAAQVIRRARCDVLVVPRDLAAVDVGHDRRTGVEQRQPS